MYVVKNMEADRPTFNTLRYLTKVKPHHIVRDDIITDDFMCQLLQEYYGFDPLQEFQNISRSFYSLEGHYYNLWRFDRPHTNRPVDPIYEQAVQCASRALRLTRKPSTYSWDDLASVPFVTNTGAGYGYVGKKGDPGNHERAIRLAVAHLNAFREESLGLAPKGSFRYTPDLAWTRTALMDLERPKVRHVWGEAFHNIIIEGIIAAPLIEAYSHADSPIVTGSNLYRRIPEIIQHTLGTSDCPMYSVGLDYSGFDTTLQCWLIDDAMNILRENIVFSDPMSEWAYRYSVHYIKNRPVVMPDGRMWLTAIGLPSGTYFTQLCGSACNLIAVYYMQLKAYNRTFDTYVLGDDSIFGIPMHLGEPKMETFKQTSQDLDLQLQLEKSVIAVRPEESHFLGHNARQFKVSRDTLELFKLLVFTEHVVPGPQVSLARLSGLLLDSALNSPALLEFYRYVQVRAREMNISPASEFSSEDRSWRATITADEIRPAELTPEKIWLLT